MVLERPEKAMSGFALTVPVEKIKETVERIGKVIIGFRFSF